VEQGKKGNCCLSGYNTENEKNKFRLAYDEKIAYILMQEGMHCIGCPSSIGESLEEACMVHGLDVNAVLADIHHYEETKKQK